MALTGRRSLAASIGRIAATDSSGTDWAARRSWASSAGERSAASASEAAFALTLEPSTSIFADGSSE